MMRVDIDDREILVAALDRLALRVAKQGRRVEFLDGKIAKAGVIHERTPRGRPAWRALARGQPLRFGFGENRLEIEEPLGIAAEDVALGGFAEEREIVDCAR